jgi:phage terminase small subunit
MAGVKGKSGGPRANSGGARAGAGRKKAAPKESANGSAVQVELEAQAQGGALKRSRAKAVEIPERDMLTLLQDIALGRVDATAGQIRAAIAAVQYTHTKKGDGGKKEEQAAAAKRVASRFSAATPPKLVAAGGKKL